MAHLVFHWVKSPAFVAGLVNKATGASYPAVSDRIIFDSRIPLPPLAEQRRIAEVLDRAEALRAKGRAALAHLDSLTQFLFLDLFGDPATNPKGWPLVRLGEQTTKIGSGSTPTGGETAYRGEGISLIRSLNVRDGEFIFKDVAHIGDKQAAKLAGVVVEENDVLLNITGASVARILPARVNQHVCITNQAEADSQRCILGAVPSRRANQAPPGENRRCGSDPRGNRQGAD